MEINEILKQLNRIANSLDEVEKPQEDFEKELKKQADLVEIMQSGGIAQELEFDNIRIIQCKNYGCFCILDNECNVIVPMYKYSYIDGFSSGYARVNVRDESTKIKKWGIINSKGEEVVPLEYDYIKKFYGRNWESVSLIKEEETYWFDFIDGTICDSDPWYRHHPRRQSDSYFSREDCYDCEGSLDEELLEDAFFSGEYVPED